MYILTHELALIQDVFISIITIIAIILFIGLNFWMRKKGITSQYVTRKLIHLTAGPTLLVSFFFYSGEWFSPYLASIAPSLFIILFFLIGSGLVQNERFVKAMARSDDPKELLRGTFYYAIVGLFVTLFCYTSFPIKATSSPLSIIVVSTLALGDGVADLFGRKINRLKFTILAQKSIPGSLSMLIVSLISCFLLLILFGYDISIIGISAVLAIFAGTLVEALSPSEIDNISIPITVVIVYSILISLLAPTSPWSVFYIHLP